MRVAILLFVAAVIAVCAAPPWEKKKTWAGQALYRENCIVCHDIDKPESKKPGPDFYQLFKREKMPLSNSKPSRAYIAVRIQFGGTLMPAFRNVLTKQQIDTLIDYIESR
jgi:mono/diheme cytochrome c family protein